MRPLFLFLLLCCTGYAASAQTPFWSTDIAPLLFNSCASCHRPGGTAPFSLLTYTEAFNMGASIKHAVEDKHMPPWPPDPTYTRLAHERMLTQQEIDKIVDWVDGGKPQGDPALAPPVPVFSNNGDLPGVPHLISKIPTYTSTAASGDIYQCFVIPSGISTEKFISAFEAIPGNRPLVHHVLVYADTTGTCAQLDAATPGPGYTSFGGVGASSAMLLGGWVPGSDPMTYPAGFGVRLPPNADIVVQVHYPAGTAGQQDSTEIHFFFTPTGNVRQVRIDPVLNHMTNMTNGPLFLAPNQIKTFTEKFDVPLFLNASILGVAPHMHLIGRNITSYGVKPGGDTVRMIRINEWDFHWQGFYMFPKIKVVPGGSTLYAHALYDNTSGNPHNPSNPPQAVSAGEGTTDEMMLVYYVYTLYQPGDENIIIDSAVAAQVPANYYQYKPLLDVYPNPAGERVSLKCFVQETGDLRADLVDMTGRLVATLYAGQKERGYHILDLRLPQVAPGPYLIRLQTTESTGTMKLEIR